jgi:hypothetical protein
MKNALPTVHDGQMPFFLIPEQERDRVIRLFARQNIGLLLSADGPAVLRVELPGYEHARAVTVVARVLRPPQTLPA